MKRNLNNKNGFTLIELMVVLVILGILASIAVPSFTGYIDKQKEKDAIAECRQVVAAAQNMYNDRLTKNDPATIYDNINYSEVAELAGVKGTITKIYPYTTLYDTSKEGDANNSDAFENSYRVSGVTYTAENGVHVRYLYNDEKIYKVTNENIYTPLEEYIKDYQQTVKKLIDDGKITNMWQQRSDYAREYLKHQNEQGNMETFLQVEPSLLGEQNKGKELYWQPYYISNGTSGPKDSTSTLLFATPKNGTEATNVHNGWKGYLIYFKGHIYESDEYNSKEDIYVSNVASLKDCKSDEDVEKWLANTEVNHFKLVD